MQCMHQLHSINMIVMMTLSLNGTRVEVKHPRFVLRVKADRLYIRILGTWVDLGVFDKDKWHAYVTAR